MWGKSLQPISPDDISAHLYHTYRNFPISSTSPDLGTYLHQSWYVNISALQLGELTEIFPRPAQVFICRNICTNCLSPRCRYILTYRLTVSMLIFPHFSLVSLCTEISPQPVPVSVWYRFAGLVPGHGIGYYSGSGRAHILTWHSPSIPDQTVLASSVASPATDKTVQYKTIYKH